MVAVKVVATVFVLVATAGWQHALIVSTDVAIPAVVVVVAAVVAVPATASVSGPVPAAVPATVLLLFAAEQ